MAIGEHPSQDATGRFAVDQLIRSKGYKIFGRPLNEDPIWERGGKQYSQSKILFTIEFEELCEAEDQEIRYHKKRRKK